MSFDTSGPMAVQARIAAIQGRFAPSTVSTVGTVPATTRSTGSTSPAAGGADFASALAKFTPGATDGSTGSISDVLSALKPGSVSLPSGSGATGAGSVGGEQVVTDARKYLGVPYVWGGTDPAKGLDCSGLVQRVYKDLGIDLPRVSQDQARVGTAVPNLAQAKPGDLICFGTPADHIGIYIGDHKMIIAPKAGDVVKVQDVYRTPSTIRRVLPESSTSAVTASASALFSPSSATSSKAMAAAPAEYKALFERAGARYGVSADLLAAVAQTESGFNPKAVSGAGAQGLMQLMPGTARGLGVDPTNPAQAVDGAARLLSQHLRSFGSTSLALAAYNAGPGAVNRYHGVPPFAETRSYVTKVLAAAGRST